ncbi:MAG: response regulator [Bacteroidota bacterium]
MILIVEDNDAMRELLKTILQNDGHMVISASDGLEAIEYYKTEGKKIELIITDIEMPKLNGVEAYRQIKKINSGVKVIFVSGTLNKKLEEQLKTDGIVGFFQKPYAPADILTKVREILGVA